MSPYPPQAAPVPALSPGALALAPRYTEPGPPPRPRGTGPDRPHGPGPGGPPAPGPGTGRDRPPRPSRPYGPGPRPGRRPRVRNPYARLFALPGTRAFTAGNLVARIPMGMFTVSAVIMIAETRGSYALAGAVTATGLAATAVVAPFTARLVDRYGQARVAVPATVLAVLGSLALLLCVRHQAPHWTLFAAYAATATTPNIGGMSRSRWAHLYRGDPEAVHAANAFEQAVDELCFVLGPVLAAFLCAALFPEAGTLVGAVLLLTGMLLFTAQRATEPPAVPRRAGHRPRSPLRVAGMPALMVVFLATGAVFGSLEIVTLAFVDGPVAGPVMALQAFGSFLAGLAYGSARPAADPGRRLPVCLVAMTVLMAGPLLASGTGSLPVLAGALLLAGMATAPTMVTGTTLVQRLTPAGQLNEGMTLAVTALLGGVSAGAAAGGWLVEHAGAGTAYVLPVAAAGLALCLAVAGTPRRALPYAPSHGDSGATAG
ncbi:MULTISPECIES: MFS transporter [Streptomyces]|uniref:MFS transporter n=1 Tax=Streptomyces changanensis TaxID=2964669 RepID=A0ABY5N5Y0_9ACTN|nr:MULTISPECIES: MFS transporter [Streptomyces]UUS31323.1 MFS transporter [Streptomyces changanensis]